MKYLFTIFFLTFILTLHSQSCTHTIQLTDTYGDGWNGGRVALSVNGVAVLTNLGSTFTTGLGPISFNFTATAGQTIRVYRTTNGAYPTEMRIRVINSLGTTIINTVQPVTGTATTGGSIGIAACAAPTPPGNDACSNATSLPCGTSNLTGTTVNATLKTAPGGGGLASPYGVWYAFTGNGQQTTVSATGTGGFDIEMTIVSGTCASNTLISSQDFWGSGTAETFTFTTVNSTVYYVYIAYWSSTGTSTQTGTFTISRTCVTPPPVPANNACLNATPITLQCPGNTTLTSGTTIGASEDAIPDPSCDGGDIRDVWYSFNTGNNTQVSITATLGTATWIGVEIYTSCGTLATGLSTICDYNLLSPNPTVITGFLMNTTYRLRIFTNASFDTPGTFSIYLNTISNSSTLSSVSGTDNQTICLNNSITSITYTTTGATGATFTGLPTGVTGSWSNNIITISGTPTVSGTFNYTVTLTGGCGTVTSTGTITINPLVSTITSISGNSTIIAGTTENYSIPSDPNATSYQWDYKESSGGSWITNISSTTSASINWSLTTTSGAEVLVTVSNSCGSQSKNLTIYVDGALPIELLSFDGSVINSRNVLLEWSTASEKNNDYFIIERSVDGYNWLQIKNIDATGNSNTQINYTTIDNSAPRAIVYYKLSQVDFDGNSEKFDPISVNLTLDEKNCDYKFYDLNGKLIDINLVSPGVYLKSCDGETIKIWKY
jgi:hypothetical protein